MIIALLGYLQNVHLSQVGNSKLRCFCKEKKAFFDNSELDKFDDVST